jgi:isoleucyl-tRNA synthetase
VFLGDYPRFESGLKKWSNLTIEEDFAAIWEIRNVVLKALEEARTAKVIGHPREARVVLTVDAASQAALKKTREDLTRLFLVSELELKSGSVLKPEVSRATGEKCARCWTHSQFVGKDKQSPDLCDRCVEALR